MTEEHPAHETVPKIACAHCHEPLNRHRPMDAPPGPESVTWRHGGRNDYDHEPVPVPMTDLEHVNHKCDFCSGPDVVWFYRTREELVAVVAEARYTDVEVRRRIGKRHEQVSNEMGVADDLSHNLMSATWTACEPCAELIEIPDVERLITRLRRLHPEHFGRPPRSFLRNFFAGFFATKIDRVPAPPRPDTPQEAQ